MDTLIKPYFLVSNPWRGCSGRGTWFSFISLHLHCVLKPFYQQVCAFEKIFCTQLYLFKIVFPRGPVKVTSLFRIIEALVAISLILFVFSLVKDEG